jgi:hypothetical protein
MYCQHCGKPSPVSPCEDCQRKALEEADRLGREALEQARLRDERERAEEEKRNAGRGVCRLT